MTTPWGAFMVGFRQEWRRLRPAPAPKSVPVVLAPLTAEQEHIARSVQRCEDVLVYCARHNLVPGWWH